MNYIVYDPYHVRYIEYNTDIQAPISNTMNNAEFREYIFGSLYCLVELTDPVAITLLLKNKAGLNQKHLKTWDEIFNLYTEP